MWYIRGGESNNNNNQTAMSAMLNNRTTKEMATFTFTRETLENGKTYFDEFNRLCNNGVLDLNAIANQERYNNRNCGHLSYEEAASMLENGYTDSDDEVAMKLMEMGEGACTWNSYNDEKVFYTEEELANLKSVDFDDDIYEVVELDSESIEEVLNYVNNEIREQDDQVRFLDMIWGLYDDLARYSSHDRKWKEVQYLEEL